jgi:cystathionine beta-lyase
MNRYNFDEVIDRRGTGSLKADKVEEMFGIPDLLPLWVADMDFRTPDFVIEAIRKRCMHEIFGYTFPGDAYFNSIIQWLEDRYTWPVERCWLSYIPGIVKGIGFVLDCFTRPGDKVIIQPPVYHPFHLLPEAMGRRVVSNPLRLENGVYRMDFEHLESIIDGDCKILILCSPHNPGGIVWDKQTLQRLAGICHRRGLLVISDEIHAEMTYPQFTHHPFPSVSGEAAACSITFMAPSKTFNIAGIVSSYAVVPDEKIRETFYGFLKVRELGEGTIFAYEATRAAYLRGKDWLKQMLAYVMANVDFVGGYLATEIPSIKIYRPQASFLVWLDCRALKLPQEELADLFISGAGLALNNGRMFGREGEGFMRLNAGCPRAVLEQALTALKKAVDRK